ncbi:hypothetical protein D3C87_1478280 [compost metagenome]
MSSRVSTRRGGFDRHLAPIFHRNAIGFLSASYAIHARSPLGAEHFLAIAIELALKAFLLNRGITDDWNRAHIGHDLVKAVKCARRAGLRDAPIALMGMAEVLGPLYQSGAFAKRSADPSFPDGWSDASGTVRALIETVGVAIRGSASRQHWRGGGESNDLLAS